MTKNFKRNDMNKVKDRKIIALLFVVIMVASLALMLCACNDKEVKELTFEEEIANISKSTLGDTVCFGKYQKSKSSETKESIEWLVVDRQDKSVLLVSKYIIDRNYIYPNTTATGTLHIWNNSYIRTWLNSTFIKTAFSVEESAYIANTTINDSDCGYSVDKVFLLSASQVKKYFSSNDKRKATATKYAAAIDWWTRSKPEKGTQVALQLRFAYVNSDGEIGSDGYDCAPGYTKMGIRPAIWVSIK